MSVGMLYLYVYIFVHIQIYMHIKADSREEYPLQLLSTLYFETGSITEPGARMTGCKPQAFHGLYPHHAHSWHWVFKHIGPHSLFTWVLGSQIQVACLHSNFSYPLCHLSRLFLLIICNFSMLYCITISYIYMMNFSCFHPSLPS